MLAGKTILLVIAGGIAAYKCLELIRRLREKGASCRAVLTRAGAEFVTPLSVAALTENKVYQELFSLTDESEMGHIRLSREADLVVVAPATADILARMATGQANDLATTALLATDKDVLCAPAMNVRMWEHAATKANLETLRGRSVRFVGPTEGDMACGEWGYGRMAEPDDIVAAIEAYFATDRPLAGIRALVTSGPTVEPIDPVRFICNRSSGRQGHAIAAALAEAGAETTLVSGPVGLPDPPGVRTLPVETAREMLAACEGALPVDVAVCAAAVCDWRPVREAGEKIKKGKGAPPPALMLEENPDILATLSRRREQRPGLVIGFAAETSNLVANAQDKLERKGCDWILGNDVSAATGTFGGKDNAVVLVTADGAEPWPRMSKEAVARRLTEAVATHLGRRP
ncbi:MAG: bifunctional phosphopantothenoylcysteine decarboxylase/phosphopantothenate--cysteine ligase CoaBC [Rhodospirillales bacterium]|nr:bifunctional phosphopantothenoylcysteine decarboxylase/phosphopantothenate--cysteine ligase CoaBC [Rhodospirillales bacterium]